MAQGLGFVADSLEEVHAIVDKNESTRISRNDESDKELLVIC